MLKEGVLETDEVAELIATAGRKDARMEPAGAPRGRRVRPVDFTRPIKFTPEQIRRLKQAIDRFCQAASTSLSAELRVPVEVTLIESSQLTWWDAYLQLDGDSINGVIEIKEIGTKWLLSAELMFVLTAIENLLGAAGGAPPEPRRLSDIDRRLARRVVDNMIHQLSTPWFDLARVELEVADFDSPADETQLVPASEPTLVLVLELRMGGTAHTVNFLIPYASIQPVEDVIVGRENSDAGGADPRVADAVSGVLNDVEVVVRAAAPAVELPIEQVLALKPGDVVRLDAPVAGGVTIFTGDEPVHRAAPGRNGVRRAVQVLGPAEKGA
jgi:flagellar motor switch protein FliM